MDNVSLQPSVDPSSKNQLSTKTPSPQIEIIKGSEVPPTPAHSPVEAPTFTASEAAQKAAALMQQLQNMPDEIDPEAIERGKAAIKGDLTDSQLDGLTEALSQGLTE